MGLINTGFGMSIIQSLKIVRIQPWSVWKGTIYFGNKHGDPQFLFHFPMKQLIIYTWVEFSEIGIIFRIIMNRKILKLP